MSVFSSLDFDNHERVVYFYDKHLGIKAIVAIHKTQKGVSLGGCRVWSYANEEEALSDVLRLSRAMTYKSALLHLPFGGAKMVVLVDSVSDKSPALFHIVGQWVKSFNGSYLTGEDLGTSVEDMKIINEITPYVVGTKEGMDISYYTALGVFQGIRAAALYRLKRETLINLRVAIQGLGKVGYPLAKLLHDAGASLVVSDVDEDKVALAHKEFQAESMSPSLIYESDVDVFSPCALGGILNVRTISLLKCAIVAGSANNQLSHDKYGDDLRNRNILYAPDYVINAGTLICAAHEKTKYDPSQVKEDVERIYDTLLDIFQRADDLGISTNKAADLIAEKFLREAEEM